MPDDTKRKPPAPKPLGRPLGTAGPKTVPGPTVGKVGGSLPCGCKVAPDEQSKLRVFFCSPHAVAYEMLDAVQTSLTVLDDLANNAPGEYDVAPAMDAAMKARKVLKKAKGDWR